MKAQEARPDVRWDEFLESRYRIIKPLGAGGMGEVVLAEDLELKRQVALKRVQVDRSKHEELVSRIERECLLHARVEPHPNIITLYDKVGRKEGIVLIMEYFPGISLKEWLADREAQGRALTTAEVVEVASQVLSALSHIHAYGIVHRDIKPDNILIREEDSGAVRVKVLDFGISRMLADEPGFSQLTLSGFGGPGTPQYMAPEQIDPGTFGPVGPAADLYALGIVLYQMLSGRPPFEGTLSQILAAHVIQPPPPLCRKDGASLPAGWTEIVGRALAKQPAERFPSAAAFLQTVRMMAEGAFDLSQTVKAIPGALLDNRTILGGLQLEPTQPMVRKRTTKMRKALRVAAACTSGLILAAMLLAMLPTSRNNLGKGGANVVGHAVSEQPHQPPKRDDAQPSPPINPEPNPWEQVVDNASSDEPAAPTVDADYPPPANDTAQKIVCNKEEPAEAGGSPKPLAISKSAEKRQQQAGASRPTEDKKKPDEKEQALVKLGGWRATEKMSSARPETRRFMQALGEAFLIGAISSAVKEELEGLHRSGKNEEAEQRLEDILEGSKHASDLLRRWREW